MRFFTVICGCFYAENRESAPAIDSELTNTVGVDDFHGLYCLKNHQKIIKSANGENLYTTKRNMQV